MLCRYSAPAVSEACREWVSTEAGWPSVANLTKLAAEHEGLQAIGLPSPDGEGIVARMQRLNLDPGLLAGGTVGQWRWLLGDGHRGLSDSEFIDAVRAEGAPGGKQALRRHPLSERQADRMARTLMMLRERRALDSEPLIRMGEDMIEQGEWR